MPYKNTEAQREYDRQKYLKNKEKILARRKERHAENREEENARCREYGKKNRKRISANVKAWRKRRNAEQRAKDRKAALEHRRETYAESPEKILARNAVYQAVRTGKIKRPDHCTRCGLVCTPEGHHPDYSKPLEVIWLCQPCHKIVHAS